MQNPENKKVGTELFSTVHMLDPRIADISSKLKYGVEKSGQESTTYRLANNSQGSTSVVSFNYHTPGVASIIDRNMYIRGSVTLSVTAKLGVASEAPLKPGVNCALAPFPFQQLLSNGSMTINNDSQNFEYDSLLNLVHRMIPHDQLNNWNSLCPTMADKYATYQEFASPGDVYDNHPWAGFDKESMYNHPNGCFPITIGAAPGAVGDSVTFDVTFKFCEPLVLPSAAISHHTSSGMGYSGVNTLNFQFNLNSKCRALRHAIPGEGNGQIPNTGISVKSINDCEILLRVLSPQVDQAIPARAIVPFYNFQRNMTDVSAGAAGSTVTSASVNLNQIPDAVLVCIRRKNAAAYHPDSCIPIRSVNVQFNNRDGILASATQEQLYLISRDNGIYQTWSEWSGAAKLSSTGESVATAGSYCLFKFGRDITLTDSFLAPGSLGKYNFQVSVVADQLIPAGYELACVFLNSSFMVSQNGSTMSYAGALDATMVEQTSRMPAIPTNQIDRMVGGSVFGRALSSLKGIAKVLKPLAKPLGKMARRELQESGDKSLKTVGNVVQALGLGQTAGARHFR